MLLAAFVAAAAVKRSRSVARMGKKSPRTTTTGGLEGSQLPFLGKRLNARMHCMEREREREREREEREREGEELQLSFGGEEGVSPLGAICPTLCV